MSLLAIRDLSLSIHGTPILDAVSLSVAPGEILAVIGESGSGKSMTALSVMGLLPGGARSVGQVLFDGRDLLQEPEARMCALRGTAFGMVFQEPMTALNPLRRIGDQVAEVLLIHGKATRRTAAAQAAAVLARVGLPEARYPASRYPHELSGGQRQRVVIAMAVACGPRLLIADEPTTALDVTTQAEILTLIRRLVAEDGMGCLFISHDLAVVADLADRLVIMRHGRVLESGDTGAVLRSSQHPYTRALISASAHRPQRGLLHPAHPCWR